MLRLFKLIKYTFIKYLLLLIKVYKARRYLLRLIKRFILAVINTFLSFWSQALNFFRRTLVFIALIFPLFARIIIYYVSYPLFKNTFRSRLYLRPHLDIPTLFELLKKRDVNFVVLRWFEDLPFIEKGEDIDILIDDDDLSKIIDLFAHIPVGQAFDIYSFSGLEGTSYKGLPYYPPILAEKIVKSRVLYNNLYYIPDKKHYFLSLAYHAVYHKGKTSGLRNLHDGYRAEADHNYEKYLQQLANELGLQVDISFQGLHHFLKKNNWVPNFDTLRKLSANDSWLYSLLQEYILTDLGDGEFIVFVLREWVVRHKKLDFILKYITDKKIDILFVKELSEQEKKSATMGLRGGKWDRGPFPVDGGKPAFVVACFDYHPIALSKKQQDRQPFIKNANVLIKNRIRNEINGNKIWFQWANFIHSADDEIEAWDYIQNVLPEQKSKLINQVCERRLQYKTEYPILRSMPTNRTRAKVELINFNGEKAIKKTYKNGRERFLTREIFAFTFFGSKTSFFPDILDSGTNYVITKFYENLLDDRSDAERNILLEPYGKEIVDILRIFFDEGYALVDFFPKNLILTPKKEIKVIDTEFLYKYKVKPSTFVNSYDIQGLPKNFDGDLPFTFSRGDRGRTYNNTWRYIIGPLKKYL